MYINLTGNYTSTLLQHIDEDQLPAYLGGKLTDPDGNPRCATMVNISLGQGK